MKTVFVLEGSLYKRQMDLEKIKTCMDSYELIYFDREDHYDRVSQEVTEISCFGEPRLFVIRELPKIEAPDKAQAKTKVLNRFKKLFPKIPVGNTVVFYGVGVSAESFFKEVRKFGEVHVFPKNRDKSDSRMFVDSYFGRRDIKLPPKIASLIVDSLNPYGKEVDFDRLCLLVKKFYNYVYKKSKITEEDVYAVCSSSKEFIVWNLYRLLDNKEFCSSMNIIHDHIGRAKNIQGETTLLLYSMAWRYSLLLMVKSCLIDKMPVKEIREKISNIKKMESKGKAQKMHMEEKLKGGKPTYKYSTKMINSVIERNYGKVAVDCYTMDELILIYYVLIKILLKIRAGCTQSEMMIALQIILLVASRQIKKKTTVDGILSYSKSLQQK